MQNQPEQFYGAWSLVNWRIEYEDGGVTHPFGEDATGQILYTQDSHMSATIMRAGRSSLAQSNARKASADQKADSFDSYFHYAGHWSLKDDSVIHHVTLSLNPDMVGTEQIRTAIFDGASGLTLSAFETVKSGGLRHHILQWKRSGNL